MSDYRGGPGSRGYRAASVLTSPPALLWRNAKLKMREGAFGAARVPALYDDVKAGNLKEFKSRDAHITSLVSGTSVKKNAFQQPQLFDFKRKRREVILQ